MNPSSRGSAYFLRPYDQRTIAVLVAIAILAVTTYWLVGVGRHGWIEWGRDEAERAEPQKIEFRVLVNEATWPELSQLPDIGETLARRIVEWRAQHGAYRDENDLLKVPGIGPKKLAAMRPHLAF